MATTNHNAGNATSNTRIIAEPGKQEIINSHTFNAPRELVFRAYTEPELLVRWLGPRNLEMSIDKMDVRPGGSWRYTNRDSSGNEFGFHGVIHDVVAPERIVQTFEFEGVPGHVALDTATFEEQSGKTTVTTRTVFQSVEDRDGMVQSGMEYGVRDSMDRLTELLEELKASA